LNNPVRLHHLNKRSEQTGPKELERAVSERHIPIGTQTCRFHTPACTLGSKTSRSTSYRWVKVGAKPAKEWL